jgi:chromosome segregation ATPase
MTLDQLIAELGRQGLTAEASRPTRQALLERDEAREQALSLKHQLTQCREGLVDVTARHDDLAGELARLKCRDGPRADALDEIDYLTGRVADLEAHARWQAAHVRHLQCRDGGLRRNVSALQKRLNSIAFLLCPPNLETH